VLLVVDVQVGVMADAWDAQRVTANVAQTVSKARSHGVPVIWVQHGDQELVHGSEAWQWVPELSRASHELLIHKPFNSAFEGTPLEAYLAGLAASHLVLAGAATNWCIRATAYAALERGYDLTLVKDAHTTSPLVTAQGTRIEAADLVADLNAAMTWLSYPGRRNATQTTGELSFGASKESA
jgi:nicotinamidase-related amidase